MKGKYKLLVISLVLIIFNGFARPVKALAAQPPVAVSFQVFYNTLSPYGRWMEYPGYGQVWMPDAGVDFQPYSTAGHWVYTDYGWTWVSDYSWGWAPFHYGRWFYDDAYGWLWEPGSEWAPAWVAWRDSPDYYGWAPLGPGMDINISVGVNIPAPLWIFVPHVYITSPYVHRYCLRRPENVYIIHRSVLINNIYDHDRRRYFGGPRTADVRRFTHQDIRRVRIDDDVRPGSSRLQHDRLNIYRPRFADNSMDRNNHSPERHFTDNRFNNRDGRNDERPQYNRPPQQPRQDDRLIRSNDVHLRDHSSNGRGFNGQAAPSRAPQQQPPQHVPQRTFSQPSNNDHNNRQPQQQQRVDFRNHPPTRIMNAPAGDRNNNREQHSIHKAGVRHF